MSFFITLFSRTRPPSPSCGAQTNYTNTVDAITMFVTGFFTVASGATLRSPLSLQLLPIMVNVVYLNEITDILEFCFFYSIKHF